MSIDPLKVIVDIQNKDELAALAPIAAHAEQEIQKLNAAFQATGKSAADFQKFQAAAMPFAETISTTTARMHELEHASAGVGRGLGQLSYAIDDMQYGFNAIVNNIPQIVMGLGGSVGIAGAVGIAAVAINQLIKHWSEFTALIEMAWSGGSYDQLVTLRERLEQAAKGYEDLKAAKTKWEEKGAKEAKELIVEAGVPKMRAALAATMTMAGQGAQMTEEEQRAAKSVQNADPGVKARVMKTIRDRLNAENEKRAETLLGSVGAEDREVDKHARERIDELMKKNPKAFDQEMRDKFAATAPGALKQKKAEEELAKFEKEFDKEVEGDAVQQKQERKMIHDADRKADRDQFNENKQRRVDELVDQQEVLHKRQRQIHEERQENRHTGAFDSYEGWLKNLGRDTGQQQLEEEKAIKKTLEDIHETLKQERRAKFA